MPGFPQESRWTCGANANVMPAPILAFRYGSKLNSMQVSGKRRRSISRRFRTILTRCHFVATQKAALQTLTKASKRLPPRGRETAHERGNVLSAGVRGAAGRARQGKAPPLPAPISGRGQRQALPGRDARRRLIQDAVVDMIEL
jgi:hypothetical protein